MTLDEIMTLREGWEFEAKLAAGGNQRGAIPGSLWETYSALANTSGGHILLGAKERSDGSLDVRGITDIDKVERDLWSTLENPSKVSVNILARDDVTRVDSPKGALLLIHVPRAKRADRPVHLNGKIESGSFKRVYEGDKRMTREQARRMLADSLPARDGEVVEHYTLDDLDDGSVARYRETFIARRPEHPFLHKTPEEFLISVGAAARDRRAGGVVRPTRAGLLMLGRQEALRDQCPGWLVSYKEAPEDAKDERRWVDHLSMDGTWNANVFEFYLRVIPRLFDGLKVPFDMEQGQFNRADSEVHRAIREALINALVHADHGGTTGIRVVKGKRGLEFLNPGRLLVAVEQVWLGGVSEPRNPVLFQLFQHLRLGEREGSGGPAMLQTWRAQHWRDPQLSEDIDHDQTKLRLTMENLFHQSLVDRLVARHGQAFSEQDELRRTILLLAESDGEASVDSVSKLSEAHRYDIQDAFHELVRHGLLTEQGSRHARHYVSRDAEDPPLLHYMAEANGVSSEANGVSSEANGVSSEANGVSSELLSAHPAVVEFVQTQRAPKDVAQRAVLALCATRFMTIAQLSHYLPRSPKTIRRIVRSLVEENRLGMRYPESPRHEAQAYRSIIDVGS